MALRVNASGTQQTKVTGVNSSNQAGSAALADPNRRLEFEKLLADVSARLVALPPERVDDEIRNALKEVLGFFP